MKMIEEISRDVNSVLTIHIDNEWSAVEFITIFDSLNRLYEFHKIFHGCISQYNIHGKEFNWNKKLNSLPKILELKSTLINESYRIFHSSNNPEDYSFYTLRTFHLGYSPLEVKSIKYGSKGSIDLVGLGKIFEIIKDLIIHYFPNKDKKIDMLIKLKEIEEKDQKILQLKIDNLKKMGIPQKEIMAIIGMESFHLSRLIQLKEKGKFIDIEIKKIDIH